MTDKLKIGKVIDKGLLNSVNECTLNGQKYIVKIEHVTKKEQTNKKSNIWNEINFSLNFANKYPEHFMSLIDYSFENDCQYIQLSWKLDKPMALWGDKLVAEYKKRIAENICIYKIYTRMDTTLYKIVNKLSHLQLYSMLIQVSYAMRLLHKNNYIHGDLHPGNVGVMKTGLKSKIKLGKDTIPTYGYQYKLIDFGLSLHKKDAITVYDKKRFFKENNYVYDEGLFTSVCSYISCDIDSFDKMMKILKNTQEHAFINEINSTNQTIQHCLYMTLYPEKYAALLSGKIIRGPLLPIPDLIFFAKYGMHSDEIYDYLLSKIKN
jgi:serine/threonine protein kinase